MALPSIVQSLLGASGSDLHAAFEQGASLERKSIAGFAYRGISLGLPGWIERLSWNTFVKVFVR